MTDVNGKVLPEKIAALVEEWKEKKESYRERFGSGWPAKLVETKFIFEGEEYVLGPESFAKEEIGSNLYAWESGLMECYQADLKKDLEALGAVRVFNMGFLD